MNIILAKSAGFCFGVKRAVETVYKEAEKNQTPIYTFGPIIHNEEVVADLEKKGVQVIHSTDELKGRPKGTVIIRSHGVERKIYDEIKALGFEIVDATCPFVLKTETTVIGTCEEAEKFTLSSEKKVCIVSQTTFNYNKFQELVEIVNEKGYDIIVLNTICNATEERQTEAERIAKEVDAMIVIGGRASSNTQKLFEICKKECENTYYIQTIKDLDLTRLKSTDNVGITAGASTPNNIIEEVQKNVRNEF